MCTKGYLIRSWSRHFQYMEKQVRKLKKLLHFQVWCSIYTLFILPIINFFVQKSHTLPSGWSLRRWASSGRRSSFRAPSRGCPRPTSPGSSTPSPSRYSVVAVYRYINRNLMVHLLTSRSWIDGSGSDPQENHFKIRRKKTDKRYKYIVHCPFICLIYTLNV